MNLRVPGPTPLPEEVRAAMGAEMIDHRSEDFEALLTEVTASLRCFFGTTGEVLALTASGTGGLEAALVNVLSPGDKVLAVSVGAFGDRFADIARAFGSEVIDLKFPWGRALDAQTVADSLRAQGPVKALLTTHNETSTGVLNDLAAVSAVLRRLGHDRPLWLVDGVSSLGAVELPMDDWGCDLVIAASQKAWMAPPGLAMLGVSARAWERMDQAACPRFYWDLRRARDFAAKGQTPFTPAVSALYGLRAALQQLSEEGLLAIAERHQRLARQLREGIKAMGLRLFADERHASPTLTAVWVPERRSAKEIKLRLAARHGVQVATGMGAFKDQVLRVAHMGYCSGQDLEQVESALSAEL